MSNMPDAGQYPERYIPRGHVYHIIPEGRRHNVAACGLTPPEDYQPHDDHDDSLRPCGICVAQAFPEPTEDNGATPS